MTLSSCSHTSRSAQAARDPESARRGYCPDTVPSLVSPAPSCSSPADPSPRGSEQPRASRGSPALQSPSLAEGAPGQGNPSLCSPGACTACSRIALGQKKHRALRSLFPALKPACVPRAFPAWRRKSRTWDLPVFAPIASVAGWWG